MEENFQVRNCNIDDVLSSKDKVYKISQIKAAIQTAFCEQLASLLCDFLNSLGIHIDPGGYLVGNKFYKTYDNWFDEGVDCEILKLGANNWQPGKLRLKVTLEFIPEESNRDEPESPLDEIRRMINEDNL